MEKAYISPRTRTADLCGLIFAARADLDARQKEYGASDWAKYKDQADRHKTDGEPVPAIGMSNTEFKDLVIRILSKGWLYCGQPLDTTKLEKRLENEKFLERFKKRVENKANRHCINEHDAVYSIFRDTNILNN